jgi:5S rRNA maturation endonuclease (ribonuclease M5)
MSKFIERLISDDFLWSAVNSYMPAKRQYGGSGFVKINCPVCLLRGEKTPDRKLRCAIYHDSTQVGVHCYNCGEKIRSKVGEPISKNMQRFLGAMGMPETEIKRLNLKALQYRSILTKSPEAMARLPVSFKPHFQPRPLPPGAMPFEHWANMANPPSDFVDAAAYLYSRGEEIATAATYYWSPSEEKAMNRRVIIPFRHEGEIVGYTARAIDEGTTRYQMEAPANFLFNAKAMSMSRRKYIILVEGVLDAVAIDGVGLLGARLNAEQIAWIKSHHKTVILVPDRDKRGQQMIDVAIENNWHVAFPKSHTAGQGSRTWWEPGVKDAAEAVKRYGKVWTLLSIIESATDNKLGIQMKRKLFI